MFREQENLFLYDWDYIVQTYKGTGCLSHFAGDFIDQFLCLPVLGPMLIALLLVLTGTVTYRICRHFSGRGISLIAASAVFFWSFMRETGNLCLTGYTVSALAYLSLVLAALQFPKLWQKALAARV